jgi:hypothetical protein
MLIISFSNYNHFIQSHQLVVLITLVILSTNIILIILVIVNHHFNQKDN